MWESARLVFCPHPLFLFPAYELAGRRETLQQLALQVPGLFGGRLILGHEVVACLHLPEPRAGEVAPGAQAQALFPGVGRVCTEGAAEAVGCSPALLPGPVGGSEVAPGAGSKPSSYHTGEPRVPMDRGFAGSYLGCGRLLGAN